MADSPFERLAEEVDGRCQAKGWEWHAELTTGSLCFWACKLTVVLTPNREDAPDRGLVAYAAAGQGPEDVFRRAWDEMQGWLDQLEGRAENVRQAKARLAARGYPG